MSVVDDMLRAIARGGGAGARIAQAKLSTPAARTATRLAPSAGQFAGLGAKYGYAPEPPSRETKGPGGLFGFGLKVLDFGRGAVTSTLKEGIDLLQGEGFDTGEWWNQATQHYGFGDLIHDEREWVGKGLIGLSPFTGGISGLLGAGVLADNIWADRIIGFIGDVAVDPLTYMGGYGALSRGLGWKKTVGALDDFVLEARKLDSTQLVRRGIASSADEATEMVTVANKAIEAASKSKSLSGAVRVLDKTAAGRKVADELGMMPGFRMRLPGTGPLGRGLRQDKMWDEALGLVGASDFIARKQMKNIPKFYKGMFSDDELLDAVKALRGGGKAGKKGREIATRASAEMDDTLRRIAGEAARSPLEIALPGFVKGAARGGLGAKLIMKAADLPVRGALKVTPKGMQDRISVLFNPSDSLRALQQSDNPRHIALGVGLEDHMRFSRGKENFFSRTMDRNSQRIIKRARTDKVSDTALTDLAEAADEITRGLRGTYEEVTGVNRSGLWYDNLPDELKNLSDEELKVLVREVDDWTTEATSQLRAAYGDDFGASVVTDEGVRWSAPRRLMENARVRLLGRKGSPDTYVADTPGGSKEQWPWEATGRFEPASLKARMYRPAGTSIGPDGKPNDGFVRVMDWEGAAPDTIMHLRDGRRILTDPADPTKPFAFRKPNEVGLSIRRQGNDAYRRAFGEDMFESEFSVLADSWKRGMGRDIKMEYLMQRLRTIFPTEKLDDLIGDIELATDAYGSAEKAMLASRGKLDSIQSHQRTLRAAAATKEMHRETKRAEAVSRSAQVQVADNQLEAMDTYVLALKAEVEEIERLLDDLGVTSGEMVDRLKEANKRLAPVEEVAERARQPQIKGGRKERLAAYEDVVTDTEGAARRVEQIQQTLNKVQELRRSFEQVVRQEIGDAQGVMVNRTAKLQADLDVASQRVATVEGEYQAAKAEYDKYTEAFDGAVDSFNESLQSEVFLRARKPQLAQRAARLEMEEAGTYIPDIEADPKVIMLRDNVESMERALQSVQEVEEGLRERIVSPAVRGTWREPKGPWTKRFMREIGGHPRGEPLILDDIGSGIGIRLEPRAGNTIKIDWWTPGRGPESFGATPTERAWASVDALKRIRTIADEITAEGWTIETGVVRGNRAHRKLYKAMGMEEVDPEGTLHQVSIVRRPAQEFREMPEQQSKAYRDAELAVLTGKEAYRKDGVPRAGALIARRRYLKKKLDAERKKMNKVMADAQKNAPAPKKAAKIELAPEEYVFEPDPVKQAEIVRLDADIKRLEAEYQELNLKLLASRGWEADIPREEKMVGAAIRQDARDRVTKAQKGVEAGRKRYKGLWVKGADGEPVPRDSTPAMKAREEELRAAQEALDALPAPPLNPRIIERKMKAVLDKLDGPAGQPGKGAKARRASLKRQETARDTSDRRVKAMQLGKLRDPEYLPADRRKMRAAYGAAAKGGKPGRGLLGAFHAYMETQSKSYVEAVENARKVLLLGDRRGALELQLEELLREPKRMASGVLEFKTKMTKAKEGGPGRQIDVIQPGRLFSARQALTEAEGALERGLEEAGQTGGMVNIVGQTDPRVILPRLFAENAAGTEGLIAVRASAKSPFTERRPHRLLRARQVNAVRDEWEFTHLHKDLLDTGEEARKAQQKLVRDTAPQGEFREGMRDNGWRFFDEDEFVEGTGTRITRGTALTRGQAAEVRTALDKATAARQGAMGGVGEQPPFPGERQPGLFANRDELSDAFAHNVENLDTHLNYVRDQISLLSASAKQFADLDKTTKAMKAIVRALSRGAAGAEGMSGSKRVDRWIRLIGEFEDLDRLLQHERFVAGPRDLRASEARLNEYNRMVQEAADTAGLMVDAQVTDEFGYAVKGLAVSAEDLADFEGRIAFRQAYWDDKVAPLMERRKWLEGEAAKAEQTGMAHEVERVKRLQEVYDLSIGEEADTLAELNGTLWEDMGRGIRMLTGTDPYLGVEGPGVEQRIDQVLQGLGERAERVGTAAQAPRVPGTSKDLEEVLRLSVERGGYAADKATSKTLFQLREPERKAAQKLLKESFSKVDWGPWALLSGDEALNAEMAAVINAFARVNDPQEWGLFLRSWDKVQTYLKSAMIATPGFLNRNIFGAFFNAWLDGVNPNEIMRSARMTTKIAKKAMNDQTDVLRAARAIAKEDATYQSYVDLLEVGVRGGGQAVSSVELQQGLRNARNLEMLIGGKMRKGGRQWSVSWQPFSARFAPYQSIRSLNSWIEDIVRLGVGMDTMRWGGNVDDALARIAKTQFDYDELTKFERNTMRRIFPFYTWTRKNVPYQLTQLARHPSKYNRLLSAKRNLELGTKEEKVVPDYFFEPFGVRLPFSRKGATVYSAPDLPFQDLARYDPFRKGPKKALQNVLSMTTPVIKAPVEASMGKQIYSGIPFTGRLQRVPQAISMIVPDDILIGIGWAERSPKGELKMPDHYIYLVTNLLPTLGVLRRMFPNEPKYQRDHVRNLLSTLGGISSNFNTKVTKNNWLINQKYERLDERQRWKDLVNPLR